MEVGFDFFSMRQHLLVLGMTMASDKKDDVVIQDSKDDVCGGGLSPEGNEGGAVYPCHHKSHRLKRRGSYVR